MKTKTRIIPLIMCAVLLISVLGGCGKSKTADKDGSTSASDTDTVALEKAANEFLNSDTAEPDFDNATEIVFSGDSAKISGDGAKASGADITITDGGTFIISGTVSDGGITVNAPKKEVIIVLNNADITNTDGSAVYVYKSSETVIYAKDGTSNSLKDGESYSFKNEFSSADDDEPNACVYSKSDLVISGGGSITVTALYNNGITSKDTLKIKDSTVNVTAKNHGINGKDCFAAKNAKINVTSGGDSLRSTNDSDSNLGYIITDGSTVNLTATEDGIQASTALFVNSGTFDITSGGGSKATAQTDVSSKGLKAGSLVKVLDGKFNLDCCDDAVHSNGNVAVSGGEFTISTGDDGIHADSNTAISGGVITVTQSYEGIEGETVDISGGTLNITASDDGLNAAGGNDQSGFGPRTDSFGGNDSVYINISGGVIEINASGDGIDSNGALNISGGEVYVSGPTDNGNGALDYDGEAVITGGTVIAAGSSGMAMNFGSNSTQGSIMINCNNSSSEIVLKDSSGNTLKSYTPAKNYSNVVISCPDIKVGETYSVTAGGQTVSVTMDSLIYGEGGGMGGNMGGMAPNGKAPDGNNQNQAPSPDGNNQAGGNAPNENGQGSGSAPDSKPDGNSQNGNRPSSKPDFKPDGTSGGNQKSSAEKG